MEKERMILGEGCFYSMDCNETGLNNNIIVCGGSGSGKTMSISEPRLLETKTSSLVATVTKRRIVKKYKPLFKERGYEILDLNYVNPLESNCAYDPLEYVESYHDITFLAESIVKADPHKEKSNADPYWDKAAISLLSALIAYILMTKENATFVDVLKLLDSLEVDNQGETIRTSLDSRFEYIASKKPGCFAVSCYKSFSCLPARTAGCVYGTLNTTIDTIFTPDLRKMLVKKKNMFYAQIFKQLFEYAEQCPNGMLPVPVHVLCDDFATGSRILNFTEYISIFREKRISVTLLLQSESQLEQMYGSGNATTIINNCDSYIYLGGMDLKTAQNMSLRLNRPLEDILYMPIGQEVVIRRGQRPIITRRYDIQKNELYQEITEEYNRQLKAAEKEQIEIYQY